MVAWRERVREITVAGFQTFDELTRIPIRRLTFLYGPNSAGKSAVEDALQILYELYGPDNIARNWLGRFDRTSAQMPAVLELAGVGNSNVRFQRLKSHWRRRGEGWDSLVDKLHLGISGWVITHLDSALASTLNSIASEQELDLLQAFIKGAPSEGSWGSEVGLVTEFRIHFEADGDHEEISPYCDVHLKINNVTVLSLIEDIKVGLNTSHWALHAYVWRNDFQSLAQKYPTLLSYENGWIWFKADYLSGQHDFPLNQLVYSWNQLSNDLTLQELLVEAKQVYDELYQITLVNWRPFDEKPNLVKASRTIPTKQDLSFLIETDPPSLDLFCLKDLGSQQYLQLAHSSLTTNGLFHRVNQQLLDHLFIERGYRLDAASRVLLSPSEFAAIKQDADSNEHTNYPKFVRLFLVDSQGREFSFSEVGTGLGYVLPVLCAVCDRNSLALIQQPELHLHPALQAALGDVLIEASSIFEDEDAKKRLVIETHSEHLLLRILKRIRQTHAGAYADEALKIQADEVAVLYFEPSPEGETKVKHLRVSEDGDFLDRWPRGFFDERGKELFDE